MASTILRVRHSAVKGAMLPHSSFWKGDTKDNAPHSFHVGQVPDITAAGRLPQRQRTMLALTNGGIVEYKATLTSQKSTEIVVRGNGSAVCLVKASDETLRTQPGLSA